MNNHLDRFRKREHAAQQELRRHGNVLTLFALLMPLFLAFVMLTLDVGLLTMDKAQLHRAADAAALAAVQERVHGQG